MELPSSVFEEIRKRIDERISKRPASKSTIEIALDDWPIWAKALKSFSKPDDKGIGDVVARFIGPENSEKFKAWHLETFGKPCGCTGRQARLNAMYPIR